MHEALWWPEKGGGTSASPAHGRAFGDSRDIATARLLKNVYEGLELSGEPERLPFPYSRPASELWKRHREEPDVLDQLEKLCKLDIQLVESRPDVSDSVKWPHAKGREIKSGSIY